VTVLITEYPIWAATGQLARPAPPRRTCKPCWLRRLRPTPISLAQNAGKNFAEWGRTGFSSSRASEATLPALSTLPERAGRPKGCRMTHENYLGAMRRADVALSVLAWACATSVFCRRTMPSISWLVFFGPFTCGRGGSVHLRTLRPEYVREAFPKYKIAYVSLVPLVLKKFAERACKARFDALPPGKRRVFNALVAVNKALTKSRPRLGIQPPPPVEASARSVWRRAPRHHRRRRLQRTADTAIFSTTLGIAVAKRLRAHGKRARRSPSMT